MQLLEAIEAAIEVDLRGIDTPLARNWLARQRAPMLTVHVNNEMGTDLAPEKRTP